MLQVYWVDRFRNIQKEEKRNINHYQKEKTAILWICHERKSKYEIIHAIQQIKIGNSTGPYIILIELMKVESSDFFYDGIILGVEMGFKAKCKHIESF